MTIDSELEKSRSMAISERSKISNFSDVDFIYKNKSPNFNVQNNKSNLLSNNDLHKKSGQISNFPQLTNRLNDPHSINMSSKYLESVRFISNKNNLFINVANIGQQPVTKENNGGIDQQIYSNIDNINEDHPNWDKNKLISLIHIFDNYLDFLNISYKNFSILQNKTYELFSASKDHEKKFEELEKSIAKIYKK